MSKISHLDLAWAAIRELGEQSRSALGALEGLGGKSPEWPTDDTGLRATLRTYGKEAIADLIAKVTGKSPRSRPQK